MIGVWIAFPDLTKHPMVTQLPDRGDVDFEIAGGLGERQILGKCHCFSGAYCVPINFNGMETHAISAT